MLYSGICWGENSGGAHGGGHAVFEVRLVGCNDICWGEMARCAGMGCVRWSAECGGEVTWMHVI